MDICRRTKATLVIAKMDRLSRNAKFMLTQLAAVAELEAGLVL